MNKEYNKNTNNILFNIDNFSKELSSDEIEKQISNASKTAIQLVDDFGCQIVFDEWTNYLKECVNSRKEAWNFMILFVEFDGQKFKVNNPYPFLGLLLNKLNLSLDKEPTDVDEKQIFQTFDTIYIELLVNSGIVKYEDYFYMNPYYDEKLIKEYNNYKNIQ